MPPYLAGREEEEKEFIKLLDQNIILENMILTGLRGVGKTVLLETFKKIAFREGWFPVGTEISESVSVKEETIVTRILTDLSLVTSQIKTKIKDSQEVGFHLKPKLKPTDLGFSALVKLYQEIPGLPSDKLKGTLEYAWSCMAESGIRGLIFAYDEAQNLSDNAPKDEYPLSLLLDVFQSIQRKNIPFMIALTGLPTLFPKLIEARTYTERMFHVIFLDRLNENESRDAIIKPIQGVNCPISFNKPSVDAICRLSGGYPYFIQFICKEIYDVWVHKASIGEELESIPHEEIMQKLDVDFFAGRWSVITDRQKDLLVTIAHSKNRDSEFRVREIVDQSKGMEFKPFKGSQVNRMLVSLGKAGLIYKNRFGKYSFAVPMLSEFILRQVYGTNS